MAAYNYDISDEADRCSKTDGFSFCNEEQLEYATYMGLSHGQETNDAMVIGLTVGGFGFIIIVSIIIWLIKFCQLSQHRKMLATRQMQMQANFGQSPMGNAPLPVVVGGYHPSGGYPLPTQPMPLQPLSVNNDMPWPGEAAPQPPTSQSISSRPPAYTAVYPPDRPAGGDLPEKF